MYPIRFENLYFEKPWGGRTLGKFRSNLPEGSIGESWDIACHPNGIGIVANGYLKGRSFKEIIEIFEEDLLGKRVPPDRMPLLIKLISAREKLSLQVHPGDKYAMQYEGEPGKTEAWYVLEAEPQGSLIVGTKDCTREQFIKALEEGKLEDYLNEFPVKQGDCFLINSGTLHAICGGVILVEIQQNSDVTYRVYDYGRPRELHLEKALQVIDFDLKAENLSKGLEQPLKNNCWYNICQSEYFSLEKACISGVLKENSDLNRFSILTCVEGEGLIRGRGFRERIALGDSYLIPAALGEYQLEGEATLLKSYPKL